MREEAVGWRVRVFWPDENEWFEGVITEFTDESGYYVCYDDGDEKWQSENDSILFLNNTMENITPEEETQQIKQDKIQFENAIDWRVKVYWKEEEESFQGIIQKYSSEMGYFIVYDDGEEKWEMDLELITFLSKSTAEPTVTEPQVAPSSPDNHEYGEDETGFEDYEESAMDINLPPTNEQNAQNEEESALPSSSRSDKKSPNSESEAKEEILVEKKNDEQKKQTTPKTQKRNIYSRSSSHHGVPFRDKETLLEMKNNLEKKKRVLTDEITRLKNDTTIEEQNAIELKRNISELTAILAFPKGNRQISKSFKPQSHEEQHLELVVSNRHIKKENIQLQNTYNETKTRIDTLKKSFNSVSEKWNALPQQHRKTLSEIELEISLFRQEVEKNEEVASTPANTTTSQNIKELLLVSDKNTIELRSKLQQSKRLLEQEKAKLIPLQERFFILQNQIEQFRSTKTLLRGAFDRYDVEKNGFLGLDEAIHIIQCIAPSDKQSNENLIGNFFTRNGSNSELKIDFTEFCNAVETLF